MAVSGKSERASAQQAVLAAVRGALEAAGLHGRRVAIGLSGGVDSVVLAHALRALARAQALELRAVHVNHGLSAQAAAWERFCARLCRDWKLAFTVRRVRVSAEGRGLQAAAREARYRALLGLRTDAIALAHHRDDQAETVLLALLRGTGPAGARGMPALSRKQGKLLVRPLLGLGRETLLAYARAERLEWIEDEANRDERYARAYLRLRVAPLLDARWPRWREALARAAALYAKREPSAEGLLRAWLAAHGLRAPSAAKLAEMLRQIVTAAPGARVAIAHEGRVLRRWRGQLYLTDAQPAPPPAPRRWRGERRLRLPEFGGMLGFRRATGEGIASRWLRDHPFSVERRRGGDRLQLHPSRPRRALKKLFQEAAVAPWERDRLPFLYCGADLVWVPGLGVDARYCARPGEPGWVPQWEPLPAP